MTGMTMQTYCLDTNIFRGLSDAKAADLSRSAQRNAIQFRCTPIVISEILSRLKDEYPKAKASLRRIVKLCGEKDYLLPVPEHQIAIALGLEEYILPSFKESCEALLQGVDLALGSSSPDNIVIKGIYSPEGDLIGQELLELNPYKKFRAEYEQKFINGVTAIVGKHKSNYKGQQDALDKSMNNPKALENLAVGLGARCSDLDRSELLRLIPQLVPRLCNLEAYMGYYCYIMKHWINQGPMKNNPYNDLHQLVYLSNQDHYIVTEDKKFVKHIPESPQWDRILTWEKARQRFQAR